MDSANNLADSITQNAGNMVDDFLKTGTQSSDLGSEFDKAATSVDDFTEKLKKAGAGAGGGKEGAEKAGGGGSLASIEKLLQKNFDELKAYAHAT
jgi:DNA anti-recombination protein RmuC